MKGFQVSSTKGCQLWQTVSHGMILTSSSNYHQSKVPSFADGIIGEDRENKFYTRPLICLH